MADELPPTDDTAAQEAKDKILADFKRNLALSRAHRTDWRTECKSLRGLAAGDQWDAADKAQLDEQERPHVTFNVAGKYFDAITGLQINNRQEIRYVAREPGDAKKNELLSGAVAWGRDLSQMADDETDAFYDCIVTGEGWMQALMDRDLDPAGVPCGVRVDPLEMFPDPSSRRRNYADARWVIRIKFISAEEYKELYGDDETDSPDFSTLDMENDDASPDVVTSLPQDYRGDVKGDSTKARRRPVGEYEWIERRPAVSLTIAQMGTRIIEEAQWPQVEAALRERGIPYEATPIRQRVFQKAVITGNRVHEHGMSPCQTGFTFKPITGKRDHNARCWYGLGRAITDPQKWTNKFFSTILYSMMSNAKGGLLAEENSFKDARKAESDWANPSSIVWMKEGAIQKGKIQPKPEAKYPQGLDRLMQFSLEALPQTSGLNLELMGMADRNQAGVLEAQRKQSAMSIIAWAFDAMRRYYVDMGRTLAEYVIEYMPEGTLVKVTGDIGAQYVPLMKSQLSMKFDVIVDQAPTSVNQQERVWAVLQTLIPQLLQAEMPIPKEVVDYAPIPTDLQQAWKQVMTPPPEKEQMQIEQANETLRGMKAENAQKESTAKLNEAKVAEIFAELQGKSPGAEREMELLKAQVDAAVQMRLAEFKTNREAETRLLIEQMKIDSNERIKTMESAIDARLERARIDADRSSKVAVASIAAAARGEEPEEEAEEGAPPKPDPQMLLVEAIKNMQSSLEKSGKKPRAYKVVRDKLGEMQSVEMDWGDE